MKKKLFILILSLILILCGCAQHTDNFDNTPDDLDPLLENNPFETENELHSGLPGSLGHGPANPNRDETGARLPFVYEEGEMQIAYEVHATGKAKNVGFLIFIDGISQPYRLDSADTSYKYMHIFDLEEDDASYPFSFVFMPVTGKERDTLALTVTSVYKPSFIPDMKETSGYGGYHETLESFYELYFEADANFPDTSAIPQNNCLMGISQSTEAVTQDHLAVLSNDRGERLTLEDLNEQVITEQYFDGQGGFIDNYAIEADGTLHVTFKITGHIGARYRHTFYINHQALTDGENVSFETVLTRGNVSVIEVEIDLSKLEDFGTFYVVSALCNAQEIMEDRWSLVKTPSVLLYKK